ncbi:MAG: chemotaxis protein CheB [Cellvibrionaceae bacterium]
MTTTKVGIISHTLVQQHHLRQIVEECGFDVSVVWLIDHLIDNIDLLRKGEPEISDVWLVDVDTFSIDQTHNALSFEHWLFDLKQPVIFGEGSTLSAADPAFHSWSRQLKAKLFSAVSQLALRSSSESPAQFVWVLAASTGGPEAVKEFLDDLPSHQGIAFVYAQHIESGQHRALANTIARNSRYTGCMISHGDKVVADAVMVVPSHHQLDLLEEGIFLARDQPWRGEYRPSIDQVVAMVADCFGEKSGVIFFSGMGDDGMTGARLMSRRGGQVWVQSPDTCASDSMPHAVQQTGCVDKVGSPKQLAVLFKQYIKNEIESTSA